MVCRTHPFASLWMLVAFACACWLTGCERTAPRAEPPPPKVMVQQPEQRQLVDYDQYHGWLDSVASVDVRSRVRGEIQKIGFTDGQLVQEGQVLFQIDPRPFEADVERAKSQLRIYKAQLDKAVLEEKRVKDLYAKGGATDKERDTALATTESLKAQVDAQGQEIKLKELDLGYSRVTAPIAGRVSRALLTVGNLVNAGGGEQVLTNITSIDPIYLYFYVDERSLQRYQKTHAASAPRAGGVKELKIPISFGLETDEGYPNSGFIDYADNKVDPTTGTIVVRGSVQNPDGRLIAGSRARIRVPVSDARGVTVVPDVAVQSDQDRKYLLVIDAKNVVQRRDVRLGKLLDDGMRIILPAGGSAPGLRADDWLIVEGVQTARVNYAVDPVKPATTQPAKMAAVENHGGER